MDDKTNNQLVDDVQQPVVVITNVVTDGKNSYLGDMALTVSLLSVIMVGFLFFVINNPDIILFLIADLLAVASIVISIIGLIKKDKKTLPIIAIVLSGLVFIILTAFIIFIIWWSSNSSPFII